MNFTQFLVILKAHYQIIKKTVIIVFSVVLVFTLLTPNSYTGKTSVILNSDKGVDPLTGLNMPGVLMPGYIPTQIDIITSHEVAKMVVDNLQLADNPDAFRKFMRADNKSWMPSFVVDFFDFFREAFDGVIEKFSAKNLNAEAQEGLDLKDNLANLLENKLGVIPPKDSSVLVISYRSSSPELAAKLANAFAEAYLQKSIQLKIDPSRQLAGYIDKQSKALRKNLETAQSKLMQYRQENGLTSESSDTDAESVRLNALTTQLVNLQSGNGTEMNSRVRQKREAELMASIEAQKELLLKLNLSRGPLSVLQHDVDNAQKALESAGQALSQNSLKGNVAQSDIVILSPALVPRSPSSPKLMKNMALSILIGALIGIGLALIVEVLDRKVRSQDDVANIFGVSVFVMSQRKDTFKDQALDFSRALRGKLLAMPQRLKHAK